jgi:hypothetical protein
MRSRGNTRNDSPHRHFLQLVVTPPGFGQPEPAPIRRLVRYGQDQSVTVK